ncbi:hypothetical protein [Methylobacterium planeticum]|uniref:Uncharacterized protein n=1 Tax=Methylobacterium planeticum TaxID=2615211 RepID=A0A6N6MTZ4_9HYPH|nr:hypothetical protein [Methylobacterium planeticum]KAB1073985.1 hypothetical protein F6X51_09690 [Methylobacterium planeticum]
MSSSAFNVFHRKTEPDLHCAIRQGRPVPIFIAEQDWEFGGTLNPDEARQPGFRVRAAEAADRLLGFYLFQALPA